MADPFEWLKNYYDSPEYKAIRAIEEASVERFGRGASQEKFDWRNEQRAAQGLPPEQRRRGGLAGMYDRGSPFLGLIAAAALPGIAAVAPGGAAAGSTAGAGTTAGTAAGTAAGGMAPVAAGGMLSKVGDFLNHPVVGAATKLGTAAYGISKQNKANQLTSDAIRADQQRWQAGAPLREAGMAGMLAPVAADTSSLATLAGQGNPFARKLPPVPAGGR